MLFIMGADAFFMCLGGMFPGTLLAKWGEQMEHVAWNGFAFYDLIFPLFLFIAGISFPFSLSKSLDMGADKKQVSWKVLRKPPLCQRTWAHRYGMDAGITAIYVDFAQGVPGPEYLHTDDILGNACSSIRT